MNVEFRLGRNRAVLKNTVGLLVAASDVEILAEAPRTQAVDQLLLQFLVVDAADAARCRIEFHAIEWALDRRRGCYLRRGRCGVRAAEFVDLVPHRDRK